MLELIVFVDFGLRGIGTLMVSINDLCLHAMELQHRRRFDRQHASLSRGSAGIYLTDLNSGHGIFVEGQRIEKNVRVLLKNGVGIRFSNLESAKMLFLVVFSGAWDI